MAENIFDKEQEEKEEPKKKPNPFASTTKKKTEPVQEAETAAEEQKPKVVIGQRKKNPFGSVLSKPKEEEPKKEEQKKESATEQPKKEETPVLQVDVKREADSDDALLAVVDVPEQEEKPAEAPKKKRTVKKTVTKKEEPAVESPSTQAVVADTPADETDPATVIGTTLALYKNEAFETIKNHIIDRYKEAAFDKDMTPVLLCEKLAEISSLSDYITVTRVPFDQFLSGFCQKEYGEFVTYGINHAVGNNDDERKKNKLNALAKMKVGDHTFNMTQAYSFASMAVAFFNAIQDALNERKNIANSMVATMKIDASLVNKIS